LHAIYEQKMKISTELETIIDFAIEEAMRTGCFSVTPDHLFLGLLREGKSEAFRSLPANGVDTRSLKEEVEEELFAEQGIPYGNEDSIVLSRESENLINLAFGEALKHGESEVTGMHMLCALLRQGQGNAYNGLKRCGLSVDRIDKGEKRPESIETPVVDISTLMRFAKNDVCS